MKTLLLHCQKHALHARDTIWLGEHLARSKPRNFFRSYFYESEHQCDKNADVFKETIDVVANATGGEGFAAIKVTALGERCVMLLSINHSIKFTVEFSVIRGTDK